jgi:hypothetical protein
MRKNNNAKTILMYYYSTRANTFLVASSCWILLLAAASSSTAVIFLLGSGGTTPIVPGLFLAAHAWSMQPQQPSPSHSKTTTTTTTTTSLHGHGHDRDGDTTRTTTTTTTTTATGGATAATTTTTTPPPSLSSSLGAKVLRELVLDAARRDEEASLDLNGIVWLEHINLVVGSRPLATYFYVDFLGLTPDAAATSSSFHVNLGQQQFHLAEAAASVAGETTSVPQRITGSIGLVVPSLETIRQSLPAAQKVLLLGNGNGITTSQFAVLQDTDENGISMTVRCPWGNIFHLYSAKVDNDLQQREMAAATAAATATADGGHDGHDDDSSLQQSQQKMVQLHASPGGAYAASRMTINRGTTSLNPGIRFIEIVCQPGTVPAIAAFYRHMLGCTVTMSDEVPAAAAAAAVCCVCVGPGVHLVFCESSSRLTNDDLQPMQGVHVCVYTGGGGPCSSFEQLYHRLNAPPHQLVWTNPRFVHLDRCDTWAQAAASRTLRFKHIVDLTTGEKLLELEHETRPMRHGQFMKVLNYEPK